MGFQTAPSLVLDSIYSHLSPGFLWVVCRRVCKSWKLEVEQGHSLYEGIHKRCLLQFWIHKQVTGYAGIIHVNHELQIYRCTKYNTAKGTCTFTPMGDMGPCTLKNETISYLPNGDRNRFDSIHIGQITTSLFPGGKPPFIEEGLKRGHLEYQTPRKIRLYDEPISEASPETSYIKLSPEEISKFEAEKMKIALSECSNQWPNKFPVEFRFSRPEVYVEILYGPYVFKCHYLTKITPIVPLPEGGETDMCNVTYTLVINEIEVPMKHLCKWRCSCPTRGYHHACDIDTLLRWECPSLHPVGSRLYRRAFTEYTLYNYSRTDTNDQMWMKMTREHSQPACMDLLFGLEQVRKKEQEYRRNTLPCPGCVQRKSLADGEIPINLPAKRCMYGLCRNCCTSPECKMHKDCFECRIARLEEFEYRHGITKEKAKPRECLQYFHGVKCCNRVKATNLAWKLRDLQYGNSLIHKFPGRQLEEQSSRDNVDA
jgi:hypothetical protein